MNESEHRGSATWIDQFQYARYCEQLNLDPESIDSVLQFESEFYPIDHPFTV